MRCCNTNFKSEYATFDGVGHKTVEEYRTGTFRALEPRCIPNNHPLILVNGPKNRPHFRHKNRADVEGTPMTNWHAEWQSHFPITEVPFKNKCGQFKDRRADVVISEFKRILEIQHSPIESGEVANRNKDYALHGHTVVWIVDAQDNLVVKKLGERRVLSFEKNPWLYEQFLSCDIVYYDVKGFIYRLNPADIKSHQVDVCEPQLKMDFIDAVKHRVELFSDMPPPQSYLYIKQQGAGSGKTFGMMQLLNNDPEIIHFQWILFITKQHAAVNVMYSEFMDQCKKGLLPQLELRGEPIVENKKYIVHYRHMRTNVETCAIFSTVDSFTYALGQASAHAADHFTSIVASIKDGYSKIKRSGSLKFAGVDPFINKESIVMVDETQDLTELYGEAFLKFVSSTNTNLCVVGDRLQSLSNRDNALTFLHRADVAQMKVVREEARNVVRRFSNPRLVRFVNSMIPFERYDLPTMTSAATEAESASALTIFRGKTIYADKSAEDDKVVREVAQIMELYEKEVAENHRVPEDFMIVTPFTSKNPLVESLQLAINVFWKDQMETNTSYIESVKSKHPYWNTVNPDEYTRYAVFHKSQEMGSINLSESERATRMVSIHSSKGDGRKVVFAIAITQGALQKFSQVAGNLIYDSLLHVAITRQKERLYFRLEENGDEVHRRVSRSISEGECMRSNIEFNFAKPKVRLYRIADDMRKFSFEELYDTVISSNEPPPLPPLAEEKMLIDMGDHNIRYASMFMNVIVHVCNHMYSDSKKQLYAILGKLKPDVIKPVTEWKEYVKTLCANSENKLGKTPETASYVPLLYFRPTATDRDYARYGTIIRQMMLRIFTELQSVSSGKLNYFCPLECVVLYYMIECIENGKYQAITINDVYNIVDTYSRAFDSTAKGHERCECKRNFPSTSTPATELQKKQSEYLRNHYDRVEHVSNILDKFVSKYPKVNWLYDHPIKYEGKEVGNFAITTSIDLVGYDEERVYLFTIKPQFNEINMNEVIVNTMCNTWLARNVNECSNNYKRFHDKPIMSCVLSLNRDDIYVMDWTNVVDGPDIDEKVDEGRMYFGNAIYNTMLKQFSDKHEQYYNTFCSVIKELSEVPKDLACCRKDKLQAPYIEKAFAYIECQMGEAGGKKARREVLDKYCDKGTFVKLFDRLLDGQLRKFVGIEDEDEDDDD